jgi:hypothetical protein
MLDSARVSQCQAVNSLCIAQLDASDTRNLPSTSPGFSAFVPARLEPLKLLHMVALGLPHFLAETASPRTCHSNNCNTMT